MAFLADSLSVITFLITKAFWNWLVNDVFGSFILSYGWRVVVFTISLKLLLFPMDFMNRRRSKLNAKIMLRIKPELDALQKKYADSPQELMMAKRAVQKKHGYGMGMTCLSAIITMILFISLWQGLTAISVDMNRESFEQLSNVYDQKYEYYGDKLDLVADANDDFVAEYIRNYTLQKKAEKSPLSDEELAAEAKAELKTVIDGFVDNPVYTQQNISESGSSTQKQFNSVRQYLAQKAVYDEYEASFKESFLWIKNIWRADTSINPIPSSSEFKNMSGQVNGNEQRYNEVMQIIKNEYTGQWNGMFILVALTVLLNFTNQFIVLKTQKKTGELEQAPGMASSMKMMLFIMPIMMGAFAINYASSFTLYMVTNAFMTLFTTFVSSTVLKIVYRD